MIIKEFNDDDLKIHEGFFENRPKKPSKKEHLEILRDSYKSIIAIDRDCIIGFLTIISDKHLCAYIPLFEIVKEYRNKGIGKKMFKMAMDITKDFYMIDLTCDDNMIAFYEKMGMFRLNAMVKRNR